MTERLHGPPALVLGGDMIGLSIARSLAPRGVRVFVLSLPHHPVRYSRHAEWIRLPGRPAEFWKRCVEFLTGPASEHLRGAVVLASVDEAIELLIEHRVCLERKFLLDRSNSTAQRLMLDKVGTYLAAREAGVPTPRFWLVSSRTGLRNVADELVFPLIIKPRHGHRFKARFNGLKHLVAHSLAEADRALETFEANGLEAFLVEAIPGPDDLLCSYYTYLDETGRAYFDFTKRIIRRYPKNMGQATYHVTDDVPGIKELSLRLFRHVGLQGVANVEYKLDRRDGRYKLIECNARFTGGNSLVLKSGVNIAELVYCQATGLPLAEIPEFRRGMRMIYPWRDFSAFMELRRLQDLDFLEWIGSLMHFQTFPIWSLRDPGPAVTPMILDIVRRLKRRWRLLWSGVATGRRLIRIR